MPTTSLGLTYPASTGHTRIWEHIQTLAQDTNTVLTNRAPLVGTSTLASSYTLTTTTSDVPGVSVTVNAPLAGARALVSWACDFQLAVAGSLTAFSLIAIDGIDQSIQALWNPGNVTNLARASIGNSFTATLATAGNHTFKLRGAVAVSSGGTIRALNQHTQLSVLVLP